LKEKPLSITLTISQLKKVGEAINQTEIESIQFALPPQQWGCSRTLPHYRPIFRHSLLLSAPHSSSKRLKPAENKFDSSGLTSFTRKFHHIQKSHCLHYTLKICQIAAGMSMNFNFMNFIFGGFLTFGTTVRCTYFEPYFGCQAKM
jgi:hypothetical protein